MARVDFFAMRITAEERQLIEKLAQREERSASDTVRLLIRQKAREIGLAPTAPKDDRLVAQPAT